MKKMKTVFVIDRTTHLATDLVQEQWVLDGEGTATATVKYDGSSVLVENGRLFRRHDVKKGRTQPPEWVPCEPAPDAHTGHWPGWLPVDATDPTNKYHIEAFHEGLPDGTFELVGPRVQGNRYGLDHHELWKHGSRIVEVARTRAAILDWLSRHEEEGLVFHHEDGRMAKVRRKDFGLKW